MQPLMIMLSLFMMKKRRILLLLLLTLLVLLLQGTKIFGDGDPQLLYLDYYRETCPVAEEIVRFGVEEAVLKDPRMAASLLRLHFHDCFVMGCDASVLLDSYGGMVSEKLAGPNNNSLRGFEVIDRIKCLLEEACPLTVSCADILAIASRDSVVMRGGPSWKVWLGRKDSLTASFNGANQFIPAPNSSLQALIANFKQQGLDTGDLIALSGSHTMGKARCVSFRQRIYNVNNIEEIHDRYKRYNSFRKILRSICPRSGRDNAIAPLDFQTPGRFDNHYYINILEGRGLLISDNVLVRTEYDDDQDEDEGYVIKEKVWEYASNQDLFFESFARSMVKMGNINVLTGIHGEIRKTCRFINT